MYLLYIKVSKGYEYSRFHPTMPGDSKNFIRRIQTFPRFYNIFIFVESDQDTLYHKLNTRRLGLTLIPKVGMTKTYLFPPMVIQAC